MSQPSMGWIDTHLHLPVDHIYARSLVSKCTVPNPAYSEAERLGFSTRGIEPFLKLYVESKKSDTYIFPRQLFNSIRDWENTVEDRTSRGLHTHLGRAIKLRATQVEPVEQAVQFLKRDYGMTLIAPPGSGKCLGKNTPVLMYDGTIKMVQDVQVGDLLMGDDNTPRTVLSLARGRENLYRIKPTKGDSWVCNESHILTLVCSRDPGKRSKKWAAGTVHDIPLMEYLRMSATKKHVLKQFAVGVDWEEQSVPLDPYFLGVWLGDGNSKNSAITTMDEEIVFSVRDEADRWGLEIRKEIISESNRASVYHLTSTNGSGRENFLMGVLRRESLINNKHIPQVYLTNSRRVRLELLAGLLDSDGHLQNNVYEISQKRKGLSDQITLLARTLGFRATQAVKVVNGVEYHRVHISGNVHEIPIHLERKRATERTQIKDVLRTSFEVEPLGEGDYYGFTIDGNHRFLLGDCTVTHNTVASLEIARRMGVKVGVLVHQSFLLNQWVDRVKEFLGIDAGVVHQNRCEFDAPIVIMMAQSINARWDKYPKELFENIGLLIVDECHRFSAETFSESVQYFRSKYRLGLTATPDRADGMGWLFQAHIGEIKVRMSVDRDDPIVYVLNTPIKLASEKPLLSRGRPDLVKAVSYVVQSEARNRLIVKYMVEAVKNNRRPICFSDRRQHLIELADMFKETCAELDIRATFGFYVGGMTEQERTIASNRQAIFATYQFAKEGLDIPELDTIVFGTPKGDIIQAVGRIQRIMAGKPKPIVFDLVDNAITMSRGLFKKRMKQYEAQKWEIKTIRNP